MNISQKHLKAFLALLAHRNFTRASASVCLSQPAFSALITGLEKEVGFRLFDRDSHQVRPTEDGKVFSEIAEHLVSFHDSSMKEIEAIRRGERGRVAMSVLPSTAVAWLPAVLPDFRKLYPGVRVEMIDAVSDRCLQLLIDGVVDFAVTACETDNPDLVSQLLYTESFYFVCPVGHPLAQRETIRIEELYGSPLLNFRHSTSIRQRIEKAIPPQILQDSLEVEQLTTMMGLVANGLGSCVVPELTLYQFRDPGIAIVPLSNFDAHRNIHLVRHADRTLSAPAANLCARLIAHAEHKCIAARGGKPRTDSPPLAEGTGAPA